MKRFTQRMVRMMHLWILLTFQFTSHALLSQDLNKGFFHLDHEELSGKSVSCIIKDSRGFMWFGTSEGLCRFDGTNVKIYKHNSRDSTSLCHNDVNAIIEDSQQNLWIGTANGLNKYDRELDNFTDVNANLPITNQLSNKFITSLASDDHGQVWIGTISGGLNIFNATTSHFVHRFSNDSNKAYNPTASITSIVIHQGRAWIGTRGGLRVVDVRTLQQESIASLQTLFHKEVTGALKGQKENLFLGFSDGEISELTYENNAVNIQRYAHIKKIAEPASYIHEISQDNNGNLWVITEKSGLLSISARTKDIAQFIPQEGNPYSAPARSLRTVYCDNNRIWVGTYNTGVYFIDQRMKKFELYQRNPIGKESLLDNNVRAFAEGKEGDIWIAGDGGLNKLNMKTRGISNPRKINELIGKKIIKTVLVDSRENLWIGTRDEGVIRINLKTFEKKTFDVISTGSGNNKILTLYEDKKKVIWAGTLGSGLFYLDKKNNQFTSLCETQKTGHVPDRSYVTSIMEDADSNLWVGTLNGLFMLQPQSDGTYGYTSYYQHDADARLSSSRITIVYEDPARRLWVGTFDHGLNRLVKEKKMFESFSEEDGLTNNSIKGIIGDLKGNLWVSSTAGISKFDPNANASKNYSKDDGLNSNTFNSGSCLRTSSGHIIFGGDNGFNIFHPDSMRSEVTPPVMYFTGFKVNNKTARIGHPDSPLKQHIAVTKTVDLSYQQRSFSIDFVALCYGPSTKNQYCYKLDGFEDNWNCSGSDHTATYTNIDPGHYVFLVKGSNSDGIWVDHPARLELIVRPPLWNTWWARLLYVLGFAGLTYLFLKIRTERIHIKTELRLEKLAREKEHELTLSKMQFFTNVSHELRTPLSLLFMPLEKIVTSPDVPNKIKSSLSTAYRNCSKLMKLVNELMDLSKFEEVKPTLGVQYGETVRFITEIASTFNDISERKNIRMILLPSTPEIYGWYDSDKIEKILRNLLSNAFKFTPAHGEIRIQVEVMECNEHNALPHRHLLITIGDNGIGIAPEDLTKVFDKFYQAKSTSSVAHPGTGIGLSLTKTLVEVHRGHITVESTYGKGTNFKVEFPIDKESFDESEVLQAPTTIINNNNRDSAPGYEEIVIDGSLGKPELLIIEDNDELRIFLATEFGLEFSVTQTADADEGFRLACEKIPDLIISDIVLPGKTGLDLCQEIKSDLRTSHIPVVLLTAKASTEDQVIGLESGADIYVPKPFSLRVLKAHVKQIITARRKLYARYSQDAYLVPGSLAHNMLDKEFLRKLVEYIDDNLLNAQLSVESIAELFNVSRSQAYRKIKALTGQTVVEFVRTIRLKHALKLMDERKYTLSEIAFKTGFNSLSYFTRSFKEQYGKAPSEFIGEAKKG